MLPINKTYIVNKDTTEFNNNNIIKKGTIVKGVFSGTMPNGEIRITTDKGQIIKYSDLQEQTNNIATDWTKFIKDLNINQGFPDRSKVTSTPVICKDGTTQIQLSSPTAQYMDACMNNGGIAINQPKANPIGSAPATDSSKNMTKMHIGLFVGGVVVGYFLLKMLKK
jgi:hypothetical protein